MSTLTHNQESKSMFYSHMTDNSLKLIYYWSVFLELISYNLHIDKIFQVYKIQDT